MSRQRSVCLTTLLLSFLFLSTLNAITYVDADASGANDGTSWEDAFTDLQDALQGTGEIWVARGVYKPTSGTDRTATFAVLDSTSLYAGFEGGETLRSERNFDPLSNGCILSGDIGVEGDDSDNSYHVVSITDQFNDCLMEGFTITGGNANGIGNNQHLGGGMLIINFSRPLLASMRFIGNQASFGGGAIYVSDANTSINNSYFYANKSGSRGGAILFDAPGRVRLYGCVFVGNTSNAGGATYAFGSNNEQEASAGEYWTNHCTFTANEATADGGAISNFGGGQTRLIHSIVWKNTAPSDTNVDPPLTSHSQGNFVGVDPGFRFEADSGDGDWFTLEDNFYGDLRLHETSNAIDASTYLFFGTDFSDLDNDFDDDESLPLDITGRLRHNGEFIDVGAFEFYEPIIYVDSSRPNDLGNGQSWQTAHQQLSTALARTREGDQVWVAEGTYTPGTSRSDTFLVPSDVSIFGGFPPGGGRRGFESRDYNPLSNNTILSGDLNGDDTPGFGNRLDNAYHVVTVGSTLGKAWIDGFKIRGGYADGSAATSRGGGIYGSFGNGPDPLVSNVIIEDNYASAEGGGISMGGGLTLVNSQVRNNESATGGGASLTNNFFSMVNVLMAENHATLRGGALYMINGNLRMANGTVYGNSSPNGSAFWGEISSEATLRNSIMWANTGSSTPVHDVFLFQGFKNIIQGEPGAVDPEIQLPSYELSATSPAIDAGGNGDRGIDAADTDMDGNFQEEIPSDGFGFWRLNGTFVDLGAYEYQKPLSGLDNSLFVESWEVGLSDGGITDFLPQPWRYIGDPANIVWRPGPSGSPSRFSQTTPLPSPAHGEHVLYIAADEAYIYRFPEVVLAEDTVYELSAAIGGDAAVDSEGWSLELWIDVDEDGDFDPASADAQLASLDRNSAGAFQPEEGLWVPNVLSYVYNAGQHATFLGKPIIVVLTNRQPDTTAYFDEVTFAVTNESALLATSPEAKSIDNDVDQPIVLTFADDIDASTITASSMLVEGSISGSVSGSISVSGSQITFTPDSPLALGETVRITFTTDARSDGNISLAGNRFSFQTALESEYDFLARLNHRRPDSYIGNSVDSATGEFAPFQSLIDVQGVRGLNFPINYRSLFTSAIGEIGIGWAHAYEIRLAGDPNGTMFVRWDSTRRNTFNYAGLGTPYESDEPSMVDHLLVRQDDGSWLLRTPGRIYYEFNTDGRLIRVGNPVFQWLLVHYSGGRLIRLEEPIAEKSLLLEYNDQEFISKITDDSLREVRLSYDSRGRLVSVTDPLLFGQALIGDPIGAPKVIPDGGAPLIHEMIVNLEGAVGDLRVEEGVLTAGADMSDVTITVIAPSGFSKVIHDRTPAGYDFAGTIIEGFDGESLAGTWQLVIQDQAGNGASSLLDWRMSYTGSTNPTNLEYEDGDFPVAGRIARASDLFGLQLYANTYDSLGRTLTQDDGVATNEIARFAYQDNGGTFTTVYTDRVGEDYTFLYDANRYLLSLMNPLGATVSFELNELGDRVSMTDELDNTWNFIYDDFGNITLMTDPSGISTTFQYDEKSNLIDINNGKAVLTYDEHDNATSLRHPSRNERTNEYDSNSQLSSARDFRFDDVDDTLSETTFILWNGSTGKERTVTLPDGGTTTTVYDAIGQVVEVRDDDGQTSASTYSQTGKITSSSDAMMNTKFFAYDYRDRLISEIDKNGNRVSFVYDGNGNMIERIAYLDETTSLTTKIEYDGEDRPTATIDPAGFEKRQVYDEVGRVVEDIDREGRRTYIRYDLAGNEIERYDNNQKLILRTEYNIVGVPIRERDANGFVTSYSYTSLYTPLKATVNGKIIAGVESVDSDDTPLSGPGGSRLIRSTYGVSGLINPANIQTRFAFDTSGRVTSATVNAEEFPVTEWEYNDDGLLDKEIYPSDSFLQFSYDELGRLETVLTSDSAENGKYYEYDAKGNIISTAFAMGGTGDKIDSTEVIQEYDALDRLVTYTDADNNRVRFQYNLAGRLALIVYPDNKTVSYTYNDAGQLETVRDWNGRTTRYTYNSVGTVSRIDFPNGTYRELFYNRNGSIDHRYDREPNGTLIVGYQYNYTFPGELAGEFPLHQETPYVPTSVTMTYDRLDRLTNYGGDPVTVDTDGRMTSPPATLSLGALDYDTFNNLESEGSNVFEYDAADRLVGWTFEGDETEFVVHPGGGQGQTLVKKNPDGTTTNYVYGIGLIYQETEGETRTMHYDVRGSTVALSNDLGSTVGRISYGPFGEIGSRTGDTDTVFLFNGLFGVITAPQGLVNMRFRWYSPELRRFISADAHRGDIYRADSMNRYAFANNNPISRIDPGGELAFLAPFIGATVGAAVGIVSTAIVDYVEDGEFNRPFTDYAGAAIGGAVTGAIITFNPGLLFTSGAAGGLAQSLYQGIFDPNKELSVKSLATDALIGGSLGKIGPAGKKGVNVVKSKLFGASKNAAKRRAVNGWGQILKVEAKEEAKFLAIKSGARAGGLLAKGFRTALINGGNDSSPGGGSESGPPDDGLPPGNSTIILRSVNEPQRSLSGVYGADLYWNFYIEALERAGRPTPTHPNQTLDNF
ncbi:MAG: RHS repeat-associated core domain-containing protein [Verrucomicrobiota bacterium]